MTVPYNTHWLRETRTEWDRCVPFMSGEPPHYASIQRAETVGYFQDREGNYFALYLMLNNKDGWGEFKRDPTGGEKLMMPTPTPPTNGELAYRAAAKEHFALPKPKAAPPAPPAPKVVKRRWFGLRGAK